jgi:hypothetical protein
MVRTIVSAAENVEVSLLPMAKELTNLVLDEVG